MAELYRHVLRVSGSAAVTHDVEPTATLEGSCHGADQRLDAIGFGAEELLLHVRALACFA